MDENPPEAPSMPPVAPPSDGPTPTVAPAPVDVGAAARPCPRCAEPISLAAKKCTHCGSDLDWRRFLSLGSTSLAMLTALIAVVAAVGPKVTAMFGPPDARLHFTVMGVGDTPSMSQSGNPMAGDTVLLASNDGSKAGAIIRPGLFVGWKSGGRSLGFVARLETPGNEPIIIPPGAVLSAKLLNNPRIILVPGTTRADAVALVTPKTAGDPTTAPVDQALCAVELTAASSAGQQSNVEVRASCPDLHDYIEEAVASLRP